MRSPRVIATVSSQPGWYVQHKDDEQPDHRYEVAAWVVLADNNNVSARPIAAAKDDELLLGDQQTVIFPPDGRNSQPH